MADEIDFHDVISELVLENREKNFFVSYRENVLWLNKYICFVLYADDW